MSGPGQPGRYVGRRVPRREDGRLLSGKGRFIADIRRPGACELVVVRSKEAHARLVGIDLGPALQAPGVIAAFTFADFADQLKPMPCVDTLADSKPAHQFALARDRVRFCGEPVAVVVASNRYLAEDAAERVAISYAPLPVVTDVTAATLEGAPLLYPEFGTNVVYRNAQQVGDYANAAARADYVYRQAFSFHRYCASPMECRGAVAEVDAATEVVTVWLSTQFPQFVRDFLATSLAIPRERLRVIAPDIGGGFGLKEALYPEDILVPLVAMRLRRPVRWIEDRREHFTASSHARESEVEVEMAAQRDGTVTGMRIRSRSNIGGAFATVGNTPGTAMVAMARMAYRIPNLDAEVLSVVTNKTPLNVYRGAGHPQAVVVVERMMDRLARKLGLDRFEIRRRNLLTPAEMPADRGTSYPGAGPVIFDSGDYPGSLDLMLDRFRIADFPAERERARSRGRLLGLGISFIVEVTSPGPSEEARIALNDDGTVTLFSGITPIGQGSGTAHSQLVAEELQIGFEHIRLVHGDTAAVPEAMGTLASRGGAVGGAAARLAARAWVEAALQVSAELLHVPIDDLVWIDGGARRRSGGPPGLTLVELGLRMAAAGPALRARLDISHRYRVAGLAYANACHAAVVEIDPGVGRVRVARYGVVHDCGTVINPQIVDGQIVGGVLQAIGGTLLEALRYDGSGRLLNPTLMDYLLPNVDDVPEFMLAHMVSPSPHNPFGMKGAGEGGFTGGPAAITNAIEDALQSRGIELNDSGPFTPSRMLELLRRPAG